MACEILSNVLLNSRQILSRVLPRPTSQVTMPKKERKVAWNGVPDKALPALCDHNNSPVDYMLWNVGQTESEAISLEFVDSTLFLENWGLCSSLTL